MSVASRRLAGVLLIVLPTVVFGDTSLLTLLISDPAYQANPLRQGLWRAGHAHAGVFLLLALVLLRYVVIPFFIIFGFPIVYWLFGAIFEGRRWANSDYASSG